MLPTYVLTFTLLQDVHCRYRIYLDEQDTETDKISLTANPDFNHTKLIKFKPATRQVSLANGQTRFFMRPAKKSPLS